MVFQKVCKKSTQMYFLSELTDGIIYPKFTETELILNGAVGVELILAFVLDCLLIYSLLKQRDLPTDSQFILSLSVADFFFSVMGLHVYITNCKSFRANVFTFRVQC